MELLSVSVTSCPVAWHHRKEPGSILLPLSLQIVIGTDEVPLPLKQAQLPGPFLITEMFQSLHHLYSPSVDLLQSPLYRGSPDLKTPDVPHQGWAEGQEHLPQPAGNAVPKAPQGPIDPLGQKGIQIKLEIFLGRCDFVRHRLYIIYHGHYRG